MNVPRAASCQEEILAIRPAPQLPVCSVCGPPWYAVALIAHSPDKLHTHYRHSPCVRRRAGRSERTSLRARLEYYAMKEGKRPQLIQWVVRSSELLQLLLWVRHGTLNREEGLRICDAAHLARLHADLMLVCAATRNSSRSVTHERRFAELSLSMSFARFRNLITNKFTKESRPLQANYRSSADAERRQARKVRHAREKVITNAGIR